VEQELPWATHIETDTAGRWMSVRWTLTAQAFGEALLGPTQAASIRSAWLSKPTSVLLLTDVITLDDSLVSLSLLAGRDPATPDSLMIEARLVAEHKLANGIQATLQWQADTRTTNFDENGRAFFGGVSIDELIDLDSAQALTDLQITLRRLPLTA
jgi:hypothetical protein